MTPRPVSVKEMSAVEFANWAERWTNDVYKLARRSGLRHGRIFSDAELNGRALVRLLTGKRSVGGGS